MSVTEINEIPNALLFAFSNTLNRSVFLTTWTPILFLIAIFICPYMHMSLPDIKGATSGAVSLIIVALLISLVSVIIPVNALVQIQGAMNTLVTYYVFALILGLIISIGMTLFLGLLSLVRGKGL
jgi:phosphotransferase system  glucose/maltose/N-acetylglucosamine-specific IIC component